MSLQNGMIQSCYYKLQEHSKMVKDERLKNMLLEYCNKTKSTETFSIELNPTGNIILPAPFTLSNDDSVLLDDERMSVDEKK